MPFIENWFYKYLKDVRWGFSKKTSKQCKKGNLVVMFHPYAAYLLSATLYNVSHGGTHPQEPGSVSECYLIQPEHLVRTRKLLMYYQSLSLFFSLTKSHLSHSFPPSSLLSDDSCFRCCLFVGWEGEAVPWQTHCLSDRHAIHLALHSAVPAFFTVTALICGMSAVFSNRHAFLTRIKVWLSHSFWMDEPMSENTHWHAPSLDTCGVWACACTLLVGH